MADKRRAWAVDQLQKSLFFHQRLHEWGLISVAQEIERISGDSLDWNLQELGISEYAWNRIIHSGIKPIIVYRIYAAVEVKGGIDPAGVLERVGAAIKSLSRAKEESPGAITILVMSGVSMSEQARRDIESNKSNVNYWFTVEDILEDPVQRNRYYGLMGIGT